MLRDCKSFNGYTSTKLASGLYNKNISCPYLLVGWARMGIVHQ